MIVTRQQIVDTARSYIGTPFRKGGRDRNSIDCVGLLICIHHDLGLPIEDSTEYQFNPISNNSIITKFVFGQADFVDGLSPRHGQIGVMLDNRFPMHFGIIAKDGGKTTFINANTKIRRVVEQDFNDWRDKLSSLLEIKGVA